MSEETPTYVLKLLPLQMVRRRYTLDKMAERSDLSTGVVQALMNGEKATPTQAKALAKALDIYWIGSLTGDDANSLYVS